MGPSSIDAADVEDVRHTVAAAASYPDWCGTAVAHIMADIDPGGDLQEEEGADAEDYALALATVVLGASPARERRHVAVGGPVVSPQPVAVLDAAVCHPQRTPGWFLDRHSVISASVAWKALSSESALAALVREKLVMPAPGMADPAANPASPLHWGQKYEPVAAALYERWFGVSVKEYGCIRHPKVDYLGASPDGVVKTPGPLYGRMLEIKNVVNRVLTGIPKREYWIQMQMQMEACNLPMCDFLECRFLEYATWAEAEADGSFSATASGLAKGPLLVLYDETAERLRYVYPPLAITTQEAYDAWEREAIAERQGMTWVQRTWWRLDEYSLVTVDRHQDWFAAVAGRFAAAWDAVEAARNAPAPTGLDGGGRIKKHDVSSNAGVQAEWGSGTCFIRQDPDED